MATVGHVVIEGHVPVELVNKAITKNSGVYGLATPGMPTGSPGMEMGDNKEAYDVMAFEKDCAMRVFKHIE